MITKNKTKTIALTKNKTITKQTNRNFINCKSIFTVFYRTINKWSQRSEFKNCTSARSVRHLIDVYRYFIRIDYSHDLNKVFTVYDDEI